VLKVEGHPNVPQWAAACLNRATHRAARTLRDGHGIAARRQDIRPIGAALLLQSEPVGEARTAPSERHRRALEQCLFESMLDACGADL